MKLCEITLKRTGKTKGMVNRMPSLMVLTINSSHKGIDLELSVAHKEIELARLEDQLAHLERALEQVYYNGKLYHHY